MGLDFPFVDSPVKREIIEACDYGQASGDWNPLLKRLNIALRNNELVGPFYLHAKMAVGGPEVDNHVILEVDNENIRWMHKFWDSLGGFEIIQKRFAEFYGEEPEPPIHFPARILAANPDSNIAHPFVVAWFLHEYLAGIKQENLAFLCGVEIVTSWEVRFEKVFRPAAKLLLDAESEKVLSGMLDAHPFGAVTTVYASLHDCGHALGYQKCLPQSPAFAQYMPPHWYGAMGELATDMATVAFFSEMVPSASSMVLHQRLFDYTYKTEMADPFQEGINIQFDMLGEAIAFEHFRKHGALTPVDDQWHLDMPKVVAAAKELLVDLETLAKELSEDVTVGRSEVVYEKGKAFIARYLTWEDGRGWLVGEDLRRYVTKLSALPLRLDRSMMDSRYPLQSTLLTA
ncbi:MAG: hypothetical protein KF716_08250 [Anaerolineae bacterium]|nr:hypothetical protein [Anaerolineae bacterium]